MPDPSKTKEYYESDLKKKKEIGKTIKNNQSTTKTYGKPKYS